MEKNSGSKKFVTEGNAFPSLFALLKCIGILTDFSDIRHSVCIVFFVFRQGCVVLSYTEQSSHANSTAAIWRNDNHTNFTGLLYKSCRCNLSTREEHGLQKHLTFVTGITFLSWPSFMSKSFFCVTFACSLLRLLFEPLVNRPHRTMAEATKQTPRTRG